MKVVEKVFDQQGFVGGDEIACLETELAKMLGVKHAVTCGSGTDALVLALKTLGLRPGDEVITTPFSFFASTSSILLCEAKPVFVDIDPVTFNLEPRLLEKALTSKTKIIMPVHLFGQTAEMEGLLSFAKNNGLKVLEDGAQSIGAKYYDRHACSMGDMGATSFYPTKNLGGAGEGGLVTTNDDSLAEKSRLLRAHGMKVRYTHDLLGWNSRMDALQGAVLRVKLPYLESWISRRRSLAKRYSDEFSKLEEKGLIVTPKTAAGRVHAWNQYTVLVENRDGVRSKLQEKGIPTDIFYPKTIPAQPVLKELGFTENGLPHAVEAARKALALPIFPELTEAEQNQVINAMSEVLLGV
jgi:dTDP-4-amino-4,6-dideoxygalactose transaminase